MDIQLLIGFLLSILPLFELRVGLPIIIEYSLRNGIPIFPYFLIVLMLNILIIFFIFWFLDFFHEILMKINIYRKSIGKILERLQRKIDKTKEAIEKFGYIVLIFFVAIPLPGSGVWTASFISWVIGADRKKSFIAMAIGVILSGLFFLLAFLGIFRYLY
tara:strand:+ start:2383 stop:2862 length:480 start_codon:yes stop_codon:yes gene_type:complete